jgi:hypothetical protein
LFRVLRRFLAGDPADPPRTWILSAEFGLIAATELIPPYDHLMNAERARDLRTDIVERFAGEISQFRPDQLFVSVGASYKVALEGCWDTLDPSVAVRFARGSIGGRASQLHTWLQGDVLADQTGPRREKEPPGVATILGVTIRRAPGEILETARVGLRDKPALAARFQTWFVPVDGNRVAPKWLVSELSGLPVGMFRTADALRVLASLGVETKKNTL